MKHHITRTQIKSKRVRVTAKEDIFTDDIEAYRNEIKAIRSDAMVLFTYETDEPYNPIPQP